MFYKNIDGKRLKELSNEYDLIYYSNWDIKHVYPEIGELYCPLIISCRSHRYPEIFKQFYRDNTDKDNIVFHVLTTDLSVHFPKAFVIPDGIDDMFFKRDFVVGFAGKQNEYKGFDLIKSACEQCGYTFKPAIDIKPSDMPNYYRSIDVYVCMSENEAFSTPVMECLAMNIPVITTGVGIPRIIDCRKTERTIEDLKYNLAVMDFKRSVHLVKEYTWYNACQSFTKLFNNTIDVNNRRKEKI